MLTPSQSRNSSHSHISNPSSPLSGNFPLQQLPPAPSPASPPSKLPESSNAESGHVQDLLTGHSTQNRSHSRASSQYNLSQTQPQSPFATQIGTPSSGFSSNNSGINASPATTPGQQEYFQKGELNIQARPAQPAQTTSPSSPSFQSRSDSRARSRPRFSLLAGLHHAFTKENEEARQLEKQTERGRDSMSHDGDSSRSPTRTPAMYNNRQGDMSREQDKRGEIEKEKEKEKKGKKSTFEKISEKLKAGVVGVGSGTGQDGVADPAQVKLWKEFKKGLLYFFAVLLFIK
jgi:hypothetical protein